MNLILISKGEVRWINKDHKHEGAVNMEALCGLGTCDRRNRTSLVCFVVFYFFII